MSNKSMVMLGAGIGGTLGGFVPELWGGGAFSAWAVITSTVGGFAGIYVAWKYLI